jgi:hypothetical protein
MKKMILVVLAIGLPFLLTGCFEAQTRASTERDLALYGAKLEAIKNQKPIFELVAKDGEQVTLSGVERLTVYGSQEGGDAIAQRVSPFWNFVNQQSGILGMLGLGYLMFPQGMPGTQIVEPTIVETPNPLIVDPVIVTP